MGKRLAIATLVEVLLLSVDPRGMVRGTDLHAQDVESLLKAIHAEP